MEVLGGTEQHFPFVLVGGHRKQLLSRTFRRFNDAMPSRVIENSRVIVVVSSGRSMRVKNPAQFAQYCELSRGQPALLEPVQELIVVGI